MKKMKARKGWRGMEVWWVCLRRQMEADLSEGHLREVAIHVGVQKRVYRNRGSKCRALGWEDDRRSQATARRLEQNK